MSSTDQPLVLVVDDDPGVRDVLGDFLRDQNYEVLSTDTAIGALGMVREHTPDVVLLDLNMPGAVHGTAIIGAISKLTRVIVITAEVDEAIARQTLHDGAMDFISKPFDFARLRTTVDAAIALSGRRTA
jgi:DNA-binding NtrC family response regulator